MHHFKKHKKKRCGKIVTGNIYYPTGELYFSGTYSTAEYNNREPWRPVLLMKGTKYYKNGNKFREGVFQRAGLLMGKEYYENGQIRFSGIFNNKDKDSTYYIYGKLINSDGVVSGPGWIHVNNSYYGPSYPVYGKWFGEDGELCYEGFFKKTTIGSLGYPKIIWPEGYGRIY